LVGLACSAFEIYFLFVQVMLQTCVYKIIELCWLRGFLFYSCMRVCISCLKGEHVQHFHPMYVPFFMMLSFWHIGRDVLCMYFSPVSRLGGTLVGWSSERTMNG
jgi:hypothetical protein